MYVSHLFRGRQMPRYKNYILKKWVCVGDWMHNRSDASYAFLYKSIMGESLFLSILSSK
jgi:hypothetical protein